MIDTASLAGDAAGGALLASAALDTVAILGRRSRDVGGARFGPLVRGRAIAARLGARYESSGGARRLAGRLDAASLRCSPTRWRVGQLAALLPTTWLVWIGGVPSGVALGVASLAVRLGSRACLHSRRDRRDDELLDAAAALARHLATELASGSTAAEALAALPSVRDAPADRRLAAIAAATAARSAVGEGVGAALRGAVAELAPGRGRDALALLATELELVVDRGCGTAVLTRLASGIDERRQTVAEVRAATAEIRMATLAIPAMALAVACLLVLSDRAVAAVALSPVGAVVGTVLGGVAAGAVVVARRLTSPFEAQPRRRA